MSNPIKNLCSITALMCILFKSNCVGCVCHGRKSNLVEVQILPIENPVGVSTMLSLVESSIRVSTNLN